VLLSQGLFVSFWRKGCAADCVEDFRYLMELTGWSKTVLTVVFFAVIFVVLIVLALVAARIKNEQAI
jgi:hypothetical protein